MKTADIVANAITRIKILEPVCAHCGANKADAQFEMIEFGALDWSESGVGQCQKCQGLTFLRGGANTKVERDL